MDPADPSTRDVFSDVVTARQNRRGRVTRRVTLGVMAVLVLLGLGGAFGEHTATRTVSENGYDLSIRYALVSRAGLDSPWTVTVRHPGGFDAPLVLATTSRYFDIFETQGLSPSPTDETASRGTVFQTFAAPPGDTFQVDFDAYIQPASQVGRKARTALLIGGRQVAAVDYHTWLLP